MSSASSRSLRRAVWFCHLSSACSPSAIVAGGVWLWRLLTAGNAIRTQLPLLALNLLIMLLGAGLIGYVSAGPSRSEAQSQTQGAPASPGSPNTPNGTSSLSSITDSPTASPPISATADPAAGASTSNQPADAPTETRTPVPGPAPKAATTTTTRTSPAGPFTGTIQIRNPQFGWTLASGQNVGGDVTDWTSGHQVWMSSRADGSSTELVQGPCQVNGGTFVCSDVRLSGESGTVEWIRVGVFTDAVAEQLNGASTLPVERALASDETLAHKG
jgi:hypothetical protein